MHTASHECRQLHPKLQRRLDICTTGDGARSLFLALPGTKARVLLAACNPQQPICLAHTRYTFPLSPLLLDHKAIFLHGNPFFAGVPGDSRSNQRGFRILGTMKAASALLLLSALALVLGKRKEEPLNRETTPFWLQDQTDGKSYLCLMRCRSEL